MLAKLGEHGNVWAAGKDEWNWLPHKNYLSVGETTPLLPHSCPHRDPGILDLSWPVCPGPRWPESTPISPAYCVGRGVCLVCLPVACITLLCLATTRTPELIFPLNCTYQLRSPEVYNHLTLSPNWTVSCGHPWAPPQHTPTLALQSDDMLLTQPCPTNRPTSLSSWPMTQDPESGIQNLPRVMSIGPLFSQDHHYYPEHFQLYS